jgi:hypothetical protein
MAITSVTPVVLTAYNTFVKESTSTDWVAIDGTLGAEFTMSQKDEKYVICVQNAASTAVNVTAIIVKGNGIQSDLGNTTVLLAQNAIAYIVIDSGRFKLVSGTDKGKVKISSLDAAGTAISADLQVKVIQLP